MVRTVENVFCRTSFTDSSAVHNDNFIAHVRDNTKIMGYHDDCHAELFLQGLHQLQNLCLDRNIQGSRRFVCNQDIRLTGQRHCDHDTLAHTAG